MLVLFIKRNVCLCPTFPTQICAACCRHPPALCLQVPGQAGSTVLAGTSPSFLATLVHPSSWMLTPGSFMPAAAARRTPWDDAEASAHR